MADPKRQRRMRALAMSDVERDEFLAVERTCRVATVGRDGPHVTPLWFAWAEGALWLYSIVRSRRWAQLAADPRVSVVVDAGEDYGELRGVEITGRTEQVGEVPRPASPDDRLAAKPDSRLAAAETEFARKYLDSADMLHDGRHGWLRVEPDTIVSWDFRKLADSR